MANMVQAVCRAAMAMAARWLSVCALAGLMAGRAVSLSMRRGCASGLASVSGLPLVGQHLLDAAVQLRRQSREHILQVLAGNPTALFDAPDPAQTETSDAATEPQSVAESIAAARERFEQGLQNLKYSVDEQGSMSRSEFTERRALPLLWNLQDALLDLQLAKNPDGRFTADISMDSRATRDLGLSIAVLGGAAGLTGSLGQVARPPEIQQFDLAQMQ